MARDRLLRTCGSIIYPLTVFLAELYMGHVAQCIDEGLRAFGWRRDPC
jgi:hypothetical protein